MRKSVKQLRLHLQATRATWHSTHPIPSTRPVVWARSRAAQVQEIAASPISMVSCQTSRHRTAPRRWRLNSQHRHHRHNSCRLIATLATRAAIHLHRVHFQAAAAVRAIRTAHPIPTWTRAPIAAAARLANNNNNNNNRLAAAAAATLAVAVVHRRKRIRIDLNWAMTRTLRRQSSSLMEITHFEIRHTDQ